MTDTPSTPTWGGSTTTPSDRPASHKSAGSSRAPSHSSSKNQKAKATSEATPLLTDTDGAPRYDDPAESSSSEIGDDVEQRRRSPAASALLRSIRRSSSPGDPAAAAKLRARPGHRWASLIALLLLCVAAVLIMVLVFFAPEVAREYAEQAPSFTATSLSIESVTGTGVRARVKGDFVMDAGRVKRKPVRDLGRAATWIASEVETKATEVRVRLPEYGDEVVGAAQVPPIKVSVRNGKVTHVDFVTELEPGELDGIRQVADDWVKGNLDQLEVYGEADVRLKSGIFSLPTQSISQAVVFQGNTLPAMPAYNIEKINIHEKDLPDGYKGMVADVALSVANDFPVDIVIPGLGFAILVDNCLPNDPYIMVADAITSPVHVHPFSPAKIDVAGTVRRLPDDLVTACPGSKDSPLDTLLGNYINGGDTTIYVRGSDPPDADTPQWITDLITDVTVPVPLPGHSFEGLVRNFSLADVHFSLPNPLAEPGTPEAQPRVSGLVKVLVALPEEMNFPLDVDRVRADADIFYKGDKLGELNLSKWQKANSTRVGPGEEGDGDSDGPALLVESKVKDVPLKITDGDVFSDVFQALLSGSGPVKLHIKADVDVEMRTALGTFAVRRIPAKGVVPVKPLPSDPHSPDFDIPSLLSPSVGNLSIVDTTRTSITLAADFNFTNPTNYSASVPYIDFHILCNDTLLGYARTPEPLEIGPGRNRYLKVEAVWDPVASGGEEARSVGRELLSRYLSGFNTSLTVKTHEGTIPACPELGRALSAFEVTLPAPRLQIPPPEGDGGDGDGDGGDNPDQPSDPDDPDDPADPDDPVPAPPHDAPHFIQSTEIHLLTSTALFTLYSPLGTTTLYITSMNATAFYRGDPVGHIERFDAPFAVPPGRSDTPRLPVSWSPGSVGYEAVKKALGGSLKLQAKAEVGVRVGEWREWVWFVGRGIGAKVRL
ncbi:hypothetical protein BDY21DRAFT_313961 [Lineolata rhizophorae]|uniref:Pre-rRNA processing protein n=1 Tax=Lineolata rhizophorae TaxID=578093 RepID=A0A6A6PBZ6_9PEZI|nr:hypothetical protein BDY21DRAFT_313961 [Lineolata rhizophorae]